MADWKVVKSGYSEIGVEWNITNYDTYISYAPVFYLYYYVNSSDPYIEYSWNLVADGSSVSSGSTTLSTGGAFKGSKQLDSFSARTIPKGTSTKSLALTLSFGDLYGGYGSEWSGSWSGTWYYTVPALASYTVSYNANGGSGAPSSQTKWYGEKLWLNTKKPTREGYTFLYWLEPDRNVKFDPDNTDDFYTDYNGEQTLVAQWQVNKLTVNYYSNYATSVSSDTLNSVDSTKNVLVKSQDFTYSENYSQYRLTNYTSTSNSFWLQKTGYTGTGNWGTTENGDTLVNQNTGFDSGQKLAEAFGKSLKTGDASVDVYAQWRENKLTVTYYSNYADTLTPDSSITPLNSVSLDKNVAIHKYDFKYATTYLNGLHDYSEPGSSLCMSRTRYSPTGYWCTSIAEDVKIEGDKTEVITLPDNVIAIGEKCNFSSGQILAQILGLSLENGDKSINLYAHWTLLASRIAIYLEDRTMVKGLLHIYDDNGDDHYGIMTVYDEQGNARQVI